MGGKNKIGEIDRGGEKDRVGGIDKARLVI